MLQKLHHCLKKFFNGSTRKDTYAHTELCLLGLRICVLAHIMTFSDNVDFLDKYVSYNIN